MKADLKRHILQFKRPAGTSRGVLHEKECWFIELWEEGGKRGIGECGLLRGLSADDRPGFEERLQQVCGDIPLGEDKLAGSLTDFPSIRFGLETTFRSLNAEDPFVLFPSDFTRGKAGIPINGLVWMGDRDFMKTQVREKIDGGFRCIKIKVGALDFDTEAGLLRYIRSEFSAEDLELRLDANGAFSPEEASEKLKVLSGYDIHSIEQPIKPRQWQEMAALCEKAPIPIALDEELIGVYEPEKRKKLMETIRPPYIILKPGLLGGFSDCDHWIALAETQKTGWWITSALESNIGLNAIAQYTYTKENPLPQGLGTGSLYTNNIPSPLRVENGMLSYRTDLDHVWTF